MASPGSPETLLKPTQACSVIIIKTAWNAPITNKLAQGAVQVLEQHGCGIRELVVPGAIELTHAVNQAVFYHQPDAVIAIGCVIEGDTPHFEYVCQSVTQGITHLNATLQVPVIFGVLTVSTSKQAKERAGGAHGNKGAEAAETALHMIALAQKNYSQ